MSRRSRREFGHAAVGVPSSSTQEYIDIAGSGTTRLDHFESFDGGSQRTVVIDREYREVQLSFDPATEGGLAFDMSDREILLNPDENPALKLEIIRSHGYDNEDFMLFLETHCAQFIDEQSLAKRELPEDKIIKIGEAYAATIEETERYLDDKEVIAFINVNNRGKLLGEAEQRLKTVKVARESCRELNRTFDEYWNNTAIVTWARNNLDNYDPANVMHQPLVHQVRTIKHIRGLYEEALAEEAAIREREELIAREQRERRNAAAVRINNVLKEHPFVAEFLLSRDFDFDEKIKEGVSPEQLADDIELLPENKAVKSWARKNSKKTSPITDVDKFLSVRREVNDRSVQTIITLTRPKTSVVAGEVARKAGELPKESQALLVLTAVAGVTVMGSHALKGKSDSYKGAASGVIAPMEQVVSYEIKPPKTLTASPEQSAIKPDQMGPEKLQIIADVDKMSAESEMAKTNIAKSASVPGGALAVNKIDRSALSILDMANINNLSHDEDIFLQNELYRAMLAARHPKEAVDLLNDYKPLNAGDYHDQLTAAIALNLKSTESVYTPEQLKLISNILADALTGTTVPSDQAKILELYSKTVAENVAASEQQALAQAPAATPATPATAPGNSAPAPAQSPNLPPKPEIKPFHPPKVKSFEDLGDKDKDIIQHRQRKIFNHLVGKHDYSPFEAVVIIGTMGGETTNYDPTVTNSIGAHGIAQWYQGRRLGLQKFARERGTTEDDFDTQVEYLVHELKTYKKYCVDAINGPKHFDSYIEIHAKLHAEIYQFEDLFEHSGHGNMDGRYRAAEKLARDYLSYKRSVIKKARKQHTDDFKKQMDAYEAATIAAQKAAQTSPNATNPPAAPQAPAEAAPKAPENEDEAADRHAAEDAAANIAIAATKKAQGKMAKENSGSERIDNLGKHTVWDNGSPHSSRLDAIKGVDSTSEESHEGSRFSVKGANGNAIISHELADNAARMVEAAKKDGIHISVASSYRTNEHQSELWNEMGRNPAVVARPGYSEHQSGQAWDINLDGLPLRASYYGTLHGGPPSPSNPRVAWESRTWRWLHKNAHKYGFRQYYNEPWHWSASGH